MFKPKVLDLMVESHAFKNKRVHFLQSKKLKAIRMFVSYAHARGVYTLGTLCRGKTIKKLGES